MRTTFTTVAMSVCLGCVPLAAQQRPQGNQTPPGTSGVVLTKQSNSPATQQNPQRPAPVAEPNANAVDDRAVVSTKRHRISRDVLDRAAQRIRWQYGRRVAPRAPSGGPVPNSRGGAGQRTSPRPPIHPGGGGVPPFDPAPRTDRGSPRIGGINANPGALAATRALAGLAAPGPFRILVYDNGTAPLGSVHDLAQQAAFNIEPLGTVVATSADFNAQLASQTWDLVLVDCPNIIPSGGFGPLETYVSAGGRAVMSFWNWDDTGSFPTLATTFGVAVKNSIDLDTATLFDSGTSNAFTGITMPNSDWHDHWIDDGDEFSPAPGGVGLAYIGSSTDPVMVLGNGGNTIAAFVIDEAGDTWLNEGSGVRLWEHMIHMVLTTNRVLVYDAGTYTPGSVHDFALQAASNFAPFGTIVGDSATFNSLLTGQEWDVVAVDCPNRTPLGGFGPLETYVSTGGKAVMSFWDWDNTVAYPTLATTFDVAVASSFSFSGQTLRDTGRSNIFAGVTMPYSEWHDHWLDDGDQFTPQSTARGLAHIGNQATPVMVSGNHGNTIAAFVIDEAGDTWVNDGSGVRLWENMIKEVARIDDILVYDHDTNHSLAQRAAMNVEPVGTVFASSADFNTLLTSRGWDAVIVDCPNSIPVGGWTDLVKYVGRGGRAVLSFWDWDNSSAQGDPNLLPAFEVSLPRSIQLSGMRLYDSKTTDIFDGVTMPNGDWNNAWNDDGDEFVPLAPGMGHVGRRETPVMVFGNSGKTIAAFVIDEAGPTWLADGSGVRLWENMIREVLGVIETLVYDENTSHQLAELGARALDPKGVVVADRVSFNPLLRSETWDIIAVDCPSVIPDGGWVDLISHVDAGGLVAMSFWDWDDSSGQGDPNLPPAFGVSVANSIPLTGQTLVDLGSAACVFDDVTMPNGDWHSHWVDGGDEFNTVSSIGLAHVGSPSTPVMALGNGNRTIAAFVVDKAGDTWLGDGSGVRLWRNMLEEILGCRPCGPTAAYELVREGVPPNPVALLPGVTSGPVIGRTWDPVVDHSSFMPLALADGLLITVAATNVSLPPLGTVLCDLRVLSFRATLAGVPFQLPVPSMCSLVGGGLCVQAVSADGSNLLLTNALDVRVGTY